MRVCLFALVDLKAAAATQSANEAATEGRMPIHQVLEDRIANLILKAVLVPACLSEKALVDSPRNVSIDFRIKNGTTA